MFWPKLVLFSHYLEVPFLPSFCWCRPLKGAVAAGHPEGTAWWGCFFVEVAGDVPDVVEGLAVFRCGVCGGLEGRGKL